MEEVHFLERALAKTRGTTIFQQSLQRDWNGCGDVIPGLLANVTRPAILIATSDSFQ